MLHSCSAEPVLTVVRSDPSWLSVQSEGHVAQRSNEACEAATGSST